MSSKKRFLSNEAPPDNFKKILEIPISQYDKENPHYSSKTIRSHGGDDSYEPELIDDNGSFGQYGRSILNSGVLNSINADEEPNQI
jgi:hypothetical protein